MHVNPKEYRLRRRKFLELGATTTAMAALGEIGPVDRAEKRTEQGAKPVFRTSLCDLLGVDYPILSDPGRTVAQAYGVVQGEKGNAKRWTFYIDKDGIIRAIDKSIKTPTAGKDVVERLKGLGIASK